VDAEGHTLVHPVLGIQLQLETAGPSHFERYEKAIELIMAWVGRELKWTFGSLFTEPEPFEPDDPFYISEHVKSLKPREFAVDSALGNALMEESGAELSMTFQGGQESWHVSPWLVRYHSILHREGAAFETCAMLRVTVPVSVDLTEFRERCIQLAETLPIRWGCAGLMLSGREFHDYPGTAEAMYAVARRYPGYDPGYYFAQGNLTTDLSAHLVVWHDHLRTVSWLNFLGPALLARLGRPLSNLGRCRVETRGELTLVQAGDAPEVGDVNRPDFPRAYRDADALLGVLRPQSTVHFLYPWSEDSTAEWLTRFER
jgi:hypothetical protein